jgi:hypothetical protein
MRPLPCLYVYTILHYSEWQIAASILTLPDIRHLKQHHKNDYASFILLPSLHAMAELRHGIEKDYSNAAALPGSA